MLRTPLVLLAAAALLASPVLAAPQQLTVPWAWHLDAGAPAAGNVLAASLTAGLTSADVELAIGDGTYYWIAFFDPARTVYAWCQDGQGAALGGDLLALAACSLEVEGDQARIAGTFLAQGAEGAAATLEGSARFRLA